MEIFDLLSKILEFSLIAYSFILIASYIILAIISINESMTYLSKNRFIDYTLISKSPLAPLISLIAPAYNEGPTIIDNVRSLLNLLYYDFEIIIVNDGSTDDSLEKLITTYELQKVNFFINEQLVTKTVRGVYKSSNPLYKRLIIVDKENGGKSDALNAGINVSKHKLVACVDVDCILEQDSLLKMIKPFLEKRNRPVIATGGVVRIANSCIIENGRLVKVNLPKKILPRIQVLEYLRAFLLGRMAWSRLNGLLLISGAFGLFDKKIIIAVGGYSNLTVGEDMELVVRMRRYMHEKGEKYKLVYIPDPLCWTESPETYKMLGKQRNRWTRGAVETLWSHRKLFLNSKYSILGMLSYPYWLIFEWFAPLIQFFGFIAFFFLGALGYVDWPFFLLILGLTYSFSIMFSSLALLAEELTFHQYKNKRDVMRLLLVGIIEPVIFQPFGVWTSIVGNFDLLTGKKKNWGEMTRVGFNKK